MALASVKLELLTGQAERSAKRLQDRTNELSKRFRDVKNRSNAAGNRIQKFGRQSAKASRNVNKLGGAIKKLLIGFSAFQAGKFVLFKTAELESQTKSLEVLTGSLKVAKQTISDLQAFGAVTPFTSTELIDTAKRLKAFGVETDKLVQTTKRLADVSGATGAELNGVATAYGQIQAKGKLQTEELLQLQERGIDVATELKKMYNMTGTEFSDALRKGQISASAVEVAFEKITSAGGKYFGGAIAQAETLNGKWSTLMDNVVRLSQALGNVLNPVLKGILDNAISVLNTINEAMNLAKLQSGLDLTQTARKQILDQAIKEAQEIVNLRNIADPFQRNEVFQKIRAEREKDLTMKYGYMTGQLQPPTIVPPLKDSNIPELLKGINGLGKATDEVGVKWQQIRETIASGLTSAIEGLISGTKSLGESLAGIAKQIASMYLRSAIMNFLPGLPAVTKAEGGYMANGIKPFASGGMATRPTLGLVGEAGEDEYIIPASKMAASMQRYSAGARGEAVIPGTGSSYAGGGAGGSTTVNYSGPILNFNSEEFVPKSAVGQIIATATSQGAKAGENRTLSTLRNSRSARSRLGM